MNEKDIKNLIYDEDLSLDELIDIKKNSDKYDLDDFDKECLDDMINEKLEEIDSNKELFKLLKKFNKYKFNIDFISTLIKENIRIRNSIEKYNPSINNIINNNDYEEYNFEEEELEDDDFYSDDLD